MCVLWGLVHSTMRPDVHVCTLGTGADNCEADWVGGVHVCTLETGADNSEADCLGGVHVCTLGSGVHIWLSRVHVYTLRSGPHNCVGDWSRKL